MPAMTARIGATAPSTIEQMKAAGKTYEPVTYDGAGHGFMRAGEAPKTSSRSARAAQPLGRRPQGPQESLGPLEKANG